MEKILFKKELAKYLKIDPSNIFLFWKGGVGLFAILSVLEIKEGDEIIWQPLLVLQQQIQ